MVCAIPVALVVLAMALLLPYYCCCTDVLLMHDHDAGLSMSEFVDHHFHSMLIMQQHQYSSSTVRHQ